MKKQNKNLFWILPPMLILGACTNTGNLNRALKKATDALNNLVNNANTLSIANVTIDDGGGPSAGTTIFIDGTSDQPLTNFCNNTDGGPTAKPCLCDFQWTELNESTGSNVVIPRQVRTTMDTVQPFSATCPAPETFTSEIADGTVIKISIVQGLANPGPSMQTDQYNFTKGTTVEGDFFDSEGRAFNDIKRYSCYEKVSKGLRVLNKNVTVTSSNGEDKLVPMGSVHCAEGNFQKPDGCQHAGPASGSAQSYYYNLFLPTQNSGLYHSENQRYVCPRVREGLNGSSTLGGEGSPWPNDATFSLAQAHSVETSVPVVGPSVLGVLSDPQTASSACSVPGNPDTGGLLSESAISYKCMGFAFKPDSNGACPSFKDAAGLTRLTYRLRRWVAMYPPHFEANGKVIEQPNAVDVIYVLDRPVDSGDPLKPYTMHGPKPCPFAYLDHKGTLQQGWSDTSPYSAEATADDPRDAFNFRTLLSAGVPTYVGTQNTSWTGVNVDDTHLPNLDSNETNSCASTIPIVNYNSAGDAEFVTLGTTHSTNNNAGTVNTVSIGNSLSVSMDKVYVRPVEAWAPHYIEDESFLACAPQAEQFQDPPLHFAKDDKGNISWCAEAYPTQVNRVEALDKPFDAEPGDAPTGYFKNFTSHVEKNTASGTCTATQPDLPSDYPADQDSCAGGANLAACAFPPSTASTTANNYFVCRAAAHPNNLYMDSADGATSICADVTCDRTVVNDGSGAFNAFPLLAPASDVETTLKADPSYNCTLTWDDGNGKTGTKTPTSGCCNSTVVSLTTGGSGGTYDAAHLEPDRACLTPTY